MFGSEDRVVKAVDDVTFDIPRQQTFALVGESGCGKSTLGRTILRLVEPTAGSVKLDGIDLTALEPEALRRMRTRMQIVFQDPYASLNPRMRVGDIIAEPLLTHGKGNRAEREARVLELMRVVGLRADCIRRYPHEFSGGQRQRIGIARALALNPEFIVCDEPLSALDVSIQAQVLNLLADLQAAFKLTYLFITHDLSVVRYFAPRVGVMFLGKMVEMGPTEDLFTSPRHPYTRFLVSAVPIPDPRQRDRKKLLIEGEIPSPMNLPSGCRFRTRCPYAAPICAEIDPPSVFEGERSWACHFPLS
jgi:oligopeptide/dipeptide ABC transporter ATP-binding protein